MNIFLVMIEVSIFLKLFITEITFKIFSTSMFRGCVNSQTDWRCKFSVANVTNTWLQSMFILPVLNEQILREVTWYEGTLVTSEHEVGHREEGPGQGVPLVLVRGLLVPPPGVLSCAAEILVAEAAIVP